LSQQCQREDQYQRTSRIPHQVRPASVGNFRKGLQITIEASDGFHARLSFHDRYYARIFSQQIRARVTRIRRIFAKNPDSWVIHAGGVARLRTRGPWVEIGLNCFSSKRPSLSSARRSLLQQRGGYGQTENEWLLLQLPSPIPIMIPEEPYPQAASSNGATAQESGLLGTYLNETGGPISGVFTGAAAPMAITTASPPGFTNPSLSIFPDGSIWPPVIRCSESLR
jgi:hypothetical protein